MNIKYTILNKIADKLNNYRTPDIKDNIPPRYDKISDYLINGEVRSAYINDDKNCYSEEINDRKEGQIYLKELLDKQCDSNFYLDRIKISFHESDNLICIDNHYRHTYIEPIYESFEDGYLTTYIKCDDKKSFNGCKEFIMQNEKFHDCIVVRDEIPCESIYKELFESNIKAESNNNENKKDKLNFVKLSGIVSKIGREFTNRDGEKAQYIELKQEFEYNDKVYHNKFSIMLDKEMIYTYKDYINEGDNIYIKGYMNSYIDINKNLNTFVSANDIEIINEKKQEK